MNIGRRAMGALSVRHGTIYRTGNIAEAICESFIVQFLNWSVNKFYSTYPNNYSSCRHGDRRQC